MDLTITDIPQRCDRSTDATDTQYSGGTREVSQSERTRLSVEGRLGASSERVPATNAALGPVVHVAGATAAHEGTRLLTGLSPQSIGRAMHQNMFRYDHSSVIEIPENCAHG